MTKKRKIPQCLDSHLHFSPLFYSIDGLAEEETRAAERRPAFFLAGKLDREYNEITFFFCACMNLAIVGANSLLLQSSQERRHMNLIYFVRLEDDTAMVAMDFTREW